MSVVHPDAAVRYEAADRARPIGAVDGVLSAAQRHGGNPHGIVRRAASDDVGNARYVMLHVARRRPVRVEIFAVDGRLAGPLLAGLAHADRIADRAAVADHIIEPPFAGPDDDGAGRGIVPERDHLAGMRGRRPEE
jgi:hypothetical protein